MGGPGVFGLGAPPPSNRLPMIMNKAKGEGGTHVAGVAGEGGMPGAGPPPGMAL